jgi:acyl-CoA thioester hydrolase
MAKNKITIPTPVCFTTQILAKEEDINYGGHVGNERFLLFAQETRMQFLKTLGCSELKFGSFGLILAEAHVEYMSELFLGEKIEIHLSITEPTRAAFECYYQIKTNRAGKTVAAANIRTNMVCFDYNERKVKSIPEGLKSELAKLAKGNLS